MIVGADGINSRIRELYSDIFKPDIAIGKNRLHWLASTRVYNRSNFSSVKMNTDFLWFMHIRLISDMSTFIVETDEQSWRNAGLDRADEAETVSYCENLFRSELEGGKLVSNKSTWIDFKRIKNAIWRHKNIVLIGDAAHTAHFSIGSGTKLAMEDAIKLRRSFFKTQTVEDALRSYEEVAMDRCCKIAACCGSKPAFF